MGSHTPYEHVVVEEDNFQEEMIHKRGYVSFLVAF
jgi:hypothetical protein